MRKVIPFVLIFALTLCLFTGCRRNQNDAIDATNDTTQASGDTSILPDASDKVDPTNGANREPEAPSETTDIIPDNMTGDNNTPGDPTNGTTGESTPDARGRKHNRSLPIH